MLLHGGPGGTHDYLEPLLALADSGRRVILYDQVGNGRSEHLRDAPPEFWTVELFKRELICLLETLGIEDRYLLLGQSWGGMLALEHALERPPGLIGMVVADSPASMPLWVEEANRLRTALPPEVQSVLSLPRARGARRTRRTTPGPWMRSTASTSAGSTRGPSRCSAPSPCSRRTRPSTAR